MISFLDFYNGNKKVKCEAITEQLSRVFKNIGGVLYLGKHGDYESIGYGKMIKVSDDEVFSFEFSTPKAPFDVEVHYNKEDGAEIFIENMFDNHLQRMKWKM